MGTDADILKHLEQIENKCNNSGGTDKQLDYLDQSIRRLVGSEAISVANITAAFFGSRKKREIAGHVASR